MYRRTMALIVAVAALTPAAGVPGQMVPVEQFDVRLEIDSGMVTNRSDDRAVVFSEVISVPQAAWLRLSFDRVVLGVVDVTGEPTILRITSLLDGAVQTLNEVHVKQWSHTSAYFNGGMLLLEIVADPDAGPSRVVCKHAFAGPLEPVVDTICDSIDDRLPSTDPRVGRNQPGTCTSWLFDDPNHCFLTAGHCASGVSVVEFNVPLSTSGGSLQHPGPEDQYAVDSTSMQSNGGAGIGNDWAYFGCFPNSVTGLTPFEAQGDFFALASTPPPVNGQSIRITGYGSTGSGVPRSWNFAQKTHVGPYATFAGTTVRYRTDTSGGNSGSPVINENTGQAIGIHTHGGCTSGGAGSNAGTGSNHAGLRNALANPQGVCQFPTTPGACCFPNGTCFELSQAECEAAFGVFQGVNTTCVTAQCPGACPADVNGDNVVDVLDLLELLANWGPCPGCPADINDDGVVDVLDLLELLAAWGPCP